MQKGKSKKSIASLYIEKYDIKDDENEEKRVRRFVRKLHQDKSVFSNYPFDYMIEEEQLLFFELFNDCTTRTSNNGKYGKD